MEGKGKGKGKREIQSVLIKVLLHLYCDKFCMHALLTKHKVMMAGYFVMVLKT